MKFKSPAPLLKNIVTTFLYLVLLAASVYGKTWVKQESPNYLVYTHLFNLVVEYDKTGHESQNFLRDQLGLSIEQYVTLVQTSREFTEAFDKAYGREQKLLSVTYRNSLRVKLGDASFAVFDRAVKEKLVQKVTLVRSGRASAPLEFSYSSSISIEDGPHKVVGNASTVTFSLAPSSPSQTCSTSATMTGPGVSASGSDSADCFVRGTSVHLESTAYQSNSEYCIMASHSGPNGQTASTSHCVTSADTPRVTSLVYELIQSDDIAIDTNPNAGGGKRLFPDKKTAADGIDRRRIRVKAQYYQATAGVRIFFRNLDADDPSSNATPLDANDTGGANVADDNRGRVNNLSAGELAIPPVDPPNPQNPFDCQTFSDGLSCLTDSSGVARVDFIVTRQPGDNFIVAASPDEAYVSGLTFATDGINLKDTNNIQTPVTATTNTCAASSLKACRTDLLTIWRRLHIEVDSMGPAQGNSVSGMFNETKKINSSATTVQITGASLEVNRFENGRLVWGTTPFVVDSNTATSVTIRRQGSGTFTVQANDPFVIYDDDDFDDNDATTLDGDLNDDVNEPDISLMQSNDTVCPDTLSPGNCNIFKIAYIRPLYDISGSHENTTFIANVNRNNLRNTIDADFDNVATEASEEFWTIYLLGGYQFEGAGDQSDLDADPYTLNNMNILIGAYGVSDVNMSTGHTDSPDGHGSILLMEMSRPTEYPQNYASRPVSRGHTTAHEVGHLFSCLHNEGGLMEVTQVRTSGIFTPTSLAWIRQAKHP